MVFSSQPPVREILLSRRAGPEMLGDGRSGDVVVFARFLGETPQVPGEDSGAFAGFLDSRRRPTHETSDVGVQLTSIRNQVPLAACPAPGGGSAQPK